MNIAEMHELFRVIGQQMGMERIRVILPSSIDEYINDSIIEIASTIIKSNTQTAFRDKVTIQDNAISPTNGLSTLYEEREELLEDGIEEPLQVTINVTDVMYLIGFSVKAENDHRWRNCRIIEPTKIESSLDDFCNRASARYPIINVISTGSADEDTLVEIYHGKSNIDSVKMKYIRMPIKVHYDENDSENNVDCDLPIHLHKDVVELAVQKFFNSVGSTSHNVR